MYNYGYNNNILRGEGVNIFLRLKKQIISTFMFVFLLSFINPGNLVLGATTTKSYVALGDSISFGMSAEYGKGYVNQFHTYLKGVEMYEGIELTNLSTPGDTSTNLKSKIALNQEVIKNANVITVNIGGNNLLAPVITNLAKLFNVNPINNPNFLFELATAIALDPDAEQKIMAMAFDPTFNAELASGVATFVSDWAEIVAAIKTMAPQADIYVNTLYNPFKPVDLFFPSFDALIQHINTAIKAGSSYYKVADVYEEFKKNQGEPLVNFDLAIGAIDPHPNTLGHEVIYKALKKLVVIPEPQTDFTVKSIFNLVTLEPNKLLDVKTTVTNNTSAEQAVVVIVALYNERNRMLNVSYISKNINPGVTENLNAGFNLPSNTTNHKVKVFVWKGDSIINSSMEPISNVVIFQ